jgi:hypothetical protein
MFSLQDEEGNVRYIPMHRDYLCTWIGKPL